MKIAVTSQNRREVTGHAGRCRRFWIYELDEAGAVAGKRLLELARTQSFHESSPHGPHPLDGVQVLITGGMGDGLSRRLAGRGIQVAVSGQSDPDAAVADWLTGVAVPAPADGQYRHGHSHGHTHAHGHAPGHSRGHSCGCHSAE